MKSQKIKIEIKHWLTGSVLFEYEAVDNTIAKTLEKAIESSADLRSADLTSADLTYADLTYANLRSANLRSANLTSADLTSADLRYADLRSANLTSADLRSADLRYANLTSANLTSADLTSADLRYADLTSANLRYAEIDAWWHVHHEILWEVLTERIANRINYIKIGKPADEVDLRLKLMKPVLGTIPNSKSGWNKLHKEECGCGWNGKTIFTKKNGLIK